MTSRGHPQEPISCTVDGQVVVVPDDGASLLEVLRDRLGITSPKDGCSPQGQCGCCTVLVDGAPRVACVTPARRVRGREVSTLDGFSEEDRRAWSDAFAATGASQCGFCTPGIIVRLEGLRCRRGGSGPGAGLERAEVDRALKAHLCRCTGWQTIREAAGSLGAVPPRRNTEAATRRAAIEGRSPQHVGGEVALGRGGFADDLAPRDALVAIPDASGDWAVGETLSEARARAGKIQGRRTTVAAGPPLEVPPGDWAVTLRTSWVEPAYLETDASWCEPGGEPSTPLGNGGAFGAKTASEVAEVACELAERHGRPVRVLYAREDSVRRGPKRPPIAAGVRPDGSGVVRVVRTPGVAELIRSVAPALEVEEVDVDGPPTSTALRGAGWVEAVVLLDAVGAAGRPFRDPDGGTAEAGIVDGAIRVRVSCGDPLDEIVLRSYCIGAVHMALSWVTSESLAVDDDGTVRDLTIRSFGVLPAAEMPPVEVEIEPSTSEPVNGSDAVFAAVAAAVWRHQGFPPDWPTGLGLAP